MEKTIKIRNEYNSLETLQSFLTKSSSFECSKEYDIWDVRTNTDGQMEQCVVLKKSGMHAVKMYFENENQVTVSYMIPSKMMNAYFGPSKKRYRNIVEIISGKIKDVALAGSQKKAFDELIQVVEKASA